MGNVVDTLLRRGFKASKLKALVNLALSRITILKEQRHARSSLASSDVLQLLVLGHHDRALLRVEQVIKERNMLDVFAIIEGYCFLLDERVAVIQQHQACPDELKEAIASLIFAASRCGEFPELQKIRSLFASYYGKDFTSRARELRNSCGVSPEIIEKLSTRLPSLENRMKVLQEIADVNGISLQLQEAPSTPQKENQNTGREIQGIKDQSSRLDGVKIEGHLKAFHEEIDRIRGLSYPVNCRKLYRDVADAAYDAFVAAAYAAAAAKAAMELFRSSPQAPNDLKSQQNELLNLSSNVEEPVLGVEKVHYPVDKYTVLDSDDEDDEPKQMGSTRNSMTPSLRVLGKGMFDETDDESVANDNHPWGGTGTQLPCLSDQKQKLSSETSSSTNRIPHSYGGLKWRSPHSVRTRR